MFYVLQQWDLLFRYPEINALNPSSIQACFLVTDLPAVGTAGMEMAVMICGQWVSEKDYHLHCLEEVNMICCISKWSNSSPRCFAGAAEQMTVTIECFLAHNPKTATTYRWFTEFRCEFIDKRNWSERPTLYFLDPYWSLTSYTSKKEFEVICGACSIRENCSAEWREHLERKSFSHLRPLTTQNNTRHTLVKS